MKEERFLFWQKWLTLANIATVGVGLLVAFGGNSIFFKYHNSFTQEVFFNGQAIDDQTLQLKNWLFGIIGGTIVGFHVLIIFISENAFKKKEAWAYYAIWSGLLSWFLIDSCISIYYDALYNVAMINIVALLIIGLPLVITRKCFSNTST